MNRLASFALIVLIAVSCTSRPLLVQHHGVVTKTLRIQPDRSAALCLKEDSPIPGTHCYTYDYDVIERQGTESNFVSIPERVGINYRAGETMTLLIDKDRVAWILRDCRPGLPDYASCLAADR